MEQRKYDDLSPEQKAAFDAWWKASDCHTVDELDERIINAAKEFLTACADRCRLNACNPEEPTREVLLEEGKGWLDEIYLEPLQ